MVIHVFIGSPVFASNEKAILTSFASFNVSPPGSWLQVKAGKLDDGQRAIKTTGWQDQTSENDMVEPGGREWFF